MRLDLYKKNPFDITRLFDSGIIISLLVTVFASHFPPQTPHQLYSQVFPVILWVIILINPIYRETFFALFSSSRSLKILAIVMLFLGYCSLSIFYSSNYHYGLNKLMGLLIGIFPLILSSYTVLRNMNENQITILLRCVVVGALMLTISLFVEKTMSYHSEDQVFFWTHVGTGRYLGFAFLASLTMQHKSQSIVSFLVMSFILTGIIICGLRATIIFALPVYIIYTVYIAFYGNQKHNKLYLVLISLMFVFGSAAYSLMYLPLLEERIINLVSISIQNDNSLNARYLGLANALSMMLEKPIFGWGLGGYDIKYGNSFDQSIFLHYPHNLIIEIGVELGIIGLLLFTFGMAKAFISIYKYHKYSLLAFIFALWSSLFSGDINYQKPLFLIFAVYLFDQAKKPYGFIKE